MLPPDGTLHPTEVTLRLVRNLAHPAVTRDTIRHADQRNVLRAECRELDALPTDAAVHLFVALAPRA